MPISGVGTLRRFRGTTSTGTLSTGTLSTGMLNTGMLSTGTANTGPLLHSQRTSRSGSFQLTPESPTPAKLDPKEFGSDWFGSEWPDSAPKLQRDAGYDLHTRSGGSPTQCVHL